MIVISDALALTLETSGDGENPVIAWGNLVTSSNIAATYTATGYPESNLANPSTVELWKSTSLATQYLTSTFGAAQDVSVIGIARHNFGTAGARITIQGDPGTGIWQTIAGPQIPGDDKPLMFVTTVGTWTAVRVKIENATVYPQAAVLLIGEGLRMPCSMAPGVTPFPHGRKRSFVNGKAQNGDYLGDIQISSRIEMSATFQALDADWYRNNLADFVDASRSPFFFAWNPSSYPNECGYAWCTNDPQPIWAYAGGRYLNLSLTMEGLDL